jgi:uncharacterized protein (TIGR03086 family)
MFESLQKLFAATRVRREEAPYAIARLQPGTPLEKVVQLQPPPLCVTVEPDGATVFLPEAELPALQNAVSVAEHDGPWTVFGLYAPFDFGVTGYLAQVCDALAARNIPVLSLATYRRDFIFGDGAGTEKAGGPRRAGAGAPRLVSGDERLDLLRRGLDQTGSLIAAVTPEQRTAPTPCGDWDVSALVGHLVHGLDNFTATARGEKPDWSRPRPPVEGDWEAAFRGRAEGLLAAWEAAPEDRRPHADMQVTEQAVHGWDLATAIGTPAASLDPAVGERALEHGRAMLKPEWRGAGGNNAFGDEVPVPEDAPVYDRLAGWFGRDPARWSRR